MESLKLSKKFEFEDIKDKSNNIRIIPNNSFKKVFNTLYSTRDNFNDLKPADPLINRKIFKITSIKFPKNTPTPTLKLPYFNYKTINQIEKFNLINNKNINNNYNNNIFKETLINNYINTNQMKHRLIYAKKSPNKDGCLTIENIINLNECDDLKSSYKKIDVKNNKEEIKKLINDNIINLGISPENIINFESNFESGNLQLAYLINSHKELIEENINKNFNNNDKDFYQLFLHNDTNTNGYSQWFFFRVINGKKNQKINLNIMNFQRKSTKYETGIKIWYFSSKKKQEKNIGWHHTKEDVNYNQNFLYRYINGKRQYYYSLSFDYTFEYDNDEIYFANSIPYTYSDIIKDLNEYSKKENGRYFFYQKKRLCKTILGNDVEYVNINNNIDLVNFDETNNKKRGIVLFARQHPGETVSSWVLKGAIEFLMEDSDEAKYIRDNFIIKIIPIVNVDGVICGNSRTSLSGCDLNRRWINPNEYLHSEIFYLKELIFNFVNKFKVDYIIDFHGHFGAFNSFFYANNKEDDISFCKSFPFICGKISKIIEFNKSIFKMPKYKKGTGRINIYKELNIENIVTLETSYFGCNQGEYINQYFNIDMLKEIGRDICNGILLSHYNSDLKQRINEINNENVLLRNKIENELNKINKEFDEYINSLKNKLNEKNNKNNSKINLEDEKIELNENVSDSESEPSRDNLDEEEVKKLLPNFSKKKNIKKVKKYKSVYKNYKLIKKTQSIIKYKNKNTINLKNKIISFPKIDKRTSLIKKDSKVKNLHSLLFNKLKNPNNSNSSFKNIYSNKKSNNLPFFLSKNNNSNTNIKNNKEDKQTQTEEKFFNLHWSNFFGLYKIISPNFDDKKYENNNSFKKYKTRTTNNDNYFNRNSLCTVSSLNQSNKDIKNESQHIQSIKTRNYIIRNSDSDYARDNFLINYKAKQKASFSNDQKNKVHSIIKINSQKGNSIQSVISSFIFNITNINRNNLLKLYLSKDDE